MEHKDKKEGFPFQPWDDKEEVKDLIFLIHRKHIADEQAEQILHKYKEQLNNNLYILI